jgi:hypothetical protein
MGPSSIQKKIWSEHAHCLPMLVPGVTASIGIPHHFIGSDHPEKDVYSCLERSSDGNMRALHVPVVTQHRYTTIMNQMNGAPRPTEWTLQNGGRNASKTIEKWMKSKNRRNRPGRPERDSVSNLVAHVGKGWRALPWWPTLCPRVLERRRECPPGPGIACPLVSVLPGDPPGSDRGLGLNPSPGGHSSLEKGWGPIDEHEVVL